MATSPDDPDKTKPIAGRNAAVWLPAGGSGQHPLILFSHGVRGCNVQSKYLMRALAEAGFVVVAPDHAGDVGSFCPDRRPEPSDLPLQFVEGLLSGGPTFYEERGKDLKEVRQALLTDGDLAALINPDQVALVGHSLGGYTVLGLAGAWPSWTMDKIVAVVALAPFVQPFKTGEVAAGIKVPVLYQVGTNDGLAPPATLDNLGIYTKTPSPACKVAYNGADHFAWTDLDFGAGFRDVIAADTVAFLKAVFDGTRPTAAILTQPSRADPECH